MRRYGLAVPALAALLPAVPAQADEAALPRSFNIPGTDTRLQVYGFIQVYGAYYLNQNLYDNGSLIGGPTDPLDASTTPDRQFTLTARTSRFGFTTLTPKTYLGDVTTQIELDFAKGQGKGTPNLRQAYVGFGNWITGLYWSNWVDLDAGASTVDFNGPIGQPCNDTGHFAQVRCTFPLSRKSRLALSVEQNVTAKGQFPEGSAPGPANPTTKPDARYPTLVAAYTYTDAWGHLGIRGLEQHYGAYTPATGTARSNRWAGAMQLSGALKVFGQDSLVGSWYTGQALGPYGIGIQAARYSGGSLQPYRNSGWQTGYTHVWNPRLRSNLVASGVQFKNDASGPSDIKSARNYFANTFVKLAPSVELGLEYGYEALTTFGPSAVTRADGSLSNRNASNKLQISLTATF
jgi:hypothetical protein